jgi:hypothetical protein
LLNAVRAAEESDAMVACSDSLLALGLLLHPARRMDAIPTSAAKIKACLMAFS